MSKKGKLILLIAFVAVALATAIYSYMVLPDYVIMQYGFSGDNPRLYSKLFAVMLPFCLTVICAVAYYIKNNPANLLVAIIGTLLPILTFAINGLI